MTTHQEMTTDVKALVAKILICILAVYVFVCLFLYMQRIPYLYTHSNVYYNKEKPAHKTILVFLSGNIIEILSTVSF